MSWNCVWILVVIVGLTRAQPATTKLDAYTALVGVNIKCVTDPVKGLTCAAVYPDQCKEQWNFPNPCTTDNLNKKITKFVHKFDGTKFLMCGEMGKLYVVQCPQFEAYHEGCGQCVGIGSAKSRLTASCETPLAVTSFVANPCTRATIAANKLFFPFPGDMNKFIHCDFWGKPWERICTKGEVWSQYDVACVNPNLLNPCARTTTDVRFLYHHPCDPTKYLKCDLAGNAYEIPCEAGLAFQETTQRCENYQSFKASALENFCGAYTFGFTVYSASEYAARNAAVVGGGTYTGTAATQNAIVATSKSLGSTSVTSNSGLNSLLEVWKTNVGAIGSSSGLTGTVMGIANRDGTTFMDGTKMYGATGVADGVSTDLDIALTQNYTFSNVPHAPPCTIENKLKKLTHFPVLGDPHSFIQCDDHGNSFLNPCPPQNWFDVHTLTCVDGPVHLRHQQYNEPSVGGKPIVNTMSAAGNARRVFQLDPYATNPDMTGNVKTGAPHSAAPM